MLRVVVSVIDEHGAEALRIVVSSRRGHGTAALQMTLSDAVVQGATAFRRRGRVAGSRGDGTPACLADHWSPCGWGVRPRIGDAPDYRVDPWSTRQVALVAGRHQASMPLSGGAPACRGRSLRARGIDAERAPPIHLPPLPRASATHASARYPAQSSRSSPQGMLPTAPVTVTLGSPVTVRPASSVANAS